MAQPKRWLNLNVGINPTGYLHSAWKYRAGSRHDIADPEYYPRLTRLAHKGVFDAVFVSDMPLLRLGEDSRPSQIIDPLILATALTSSKPGPTPKRRSPRWHGARAPDGTTIVVRAPRAGSGCSTLWPTDIRQLC